MNMPGIWCEIIDRNGNLLWRGKALTEEDAWVAMRYRNYNDNTTNLLKKEGFVYRIITND